MNNIDIYHEKALTFAVNNSGICREQHWHLPRTLWCLLQVMQKF